MSKRIFNLAAILAAIIAISLQISGLDQIAKGVGTIARGATADADQREAIHAKASQFVDRGEIIQCIGLGFAAASVGLVIESWRRGESGRSSIPVTLLIVYLIFSLVLV